MLRALSMPVMLLLAEDGHGKVPAMGSLAQENIADLQLRRMNGGHHFHMEGNVPEVATVIAEFLELAGAQP